MTGTIIPLSKTGVRCPKCDRAEIHTTNGVGFCARCGWMIGKPVHARTAGTVVVITGGPHCGRLGTVREFLPNGAATVTRAVVEISEDGSRVVVPRVYTDARTFTCHTCCNTFRVTLEQFTAGEQCASCDNADASGV